VNDLRCEHSKSVKNKRTSMGDTVRRLKQELTEQRTVQRQLMNAEKDFFDNAKKMELQRHADCMRSLEEAQTNRIQQIRDCAEHYARQLAQTRSQYAVKKRAITRAFQRDLGRLQPEEGAACEDNALSGDDIVDEKYAEIVAAEIQRLRSEAPRNASLARYQNRRLRALAEELEAYIQRT
jgi:hypothetical protein